MGEGKTHDNNHQVFHQDSWFQYGDHMKNKDSFENCTSSSDTSSIQDSMGSDGSSLSSSCDTTDDASSPTSSSFSTNSSGGLYDLSEIMEQLPIKRGLSKFYQGKSESFTSLSSVTSLEDLAKKTPPYRKNLNSSKSCGTGLNSYKPYTLPKAIISKRSAKGSLISVKRGSCLFSRPPLSPQLH